MLNITPKNELIKEKKKDLPQFNNERRELVTRNIERDKGLILSDVLPKLHHAIALNKYFRNADTFSFSLPLIDFSNVDFSNEDVEKTLENYYFLYETIVREDYYGEKMICNRVSHILSEILGFDVFFLKTEINKEDKKVHFELRISKKMAKVKSDKEKELISFLDVYLKELLQFEHFQTAIENCLDFLGSDEVISCSKKDLDFYPVMNLEIQPLFAATNLFNELGLNPEENKLHIDVFLKNSKHIQFLNRKLKEYGYSAEFVAIQDEANVFHPIGAKIGFSTFNKERLTNKDLLPKSNDLIEKFNKKLQMYYDFVSEKAKEQNDSLIQRVKDGEFDEYVATNWAKATTMSTTPITQSYFKTHRGDEYLKFDFCLPFERENLLLTRFNPVIYNNYGVGNAYMGLLYNVVDALKERYPFFEDSLAIGDDSSDFEKQTKHSKKTGETSANLGFSMSVGQCIYNTQRNEIMQFVGEFFGFLDIDNYLPEIELNGEGISKKIEAFSNGESKHSVLSEFEIVFASINFSKLEDLFEKSNMNPKIQDLFHAKHENKFWSYHDLSEEYIQVKHTEFYNLKLANLFIQALTLHPTFITLKEELLPFGYDLTVQTIKTERFETKTGKLNINNKDMFDTIHSYSVNIVIR